MFFSFLERYGYLTEHFTIFETPKSVTRRVLFSSEMLINVLEGFNIAKHSVVRNYELVSPGNNLSRPTAAFCGTGYASPPPPESRRPESRTSRVPRTLTQGWRGGCSTWGRSTARARLPNPRRSRCFPGPDHSWSSGGEDEVVCSDKKLERIYIRTQTQYIYVYILYSEGKERLFWCLWHV